MQTLCHFYSFYSPCLLLSVLGALELGIANKLAYLINRKKIKRTIQSISRAHQARQNSSHDQNGWRIVNAHLHYSFFSLMHRIPRGRVGLFSYNIILGIHYACNWCCHITSVVEVAKEVFIILLFREEINTWLFE